MNVRAAFVAAALAVSPLLAHADVYRSVDAQGHVQYSDTPTPGATLVKTTGSERLASAAPSDAKKLDQANQSIAAQQASAANKAAVAQDVAKVQGEQCKRATDAYQASIQARRIYRNGDNGERVYLSDADADAERAKNRQAMQDACGNSQ